MMKKLYPSLFLLISLFFVGTNTVKAEDLQTDSLALVDLYKNCGGADWSGFDTWLNGPISTWEGVTVDAEMQRVTHVAFKNMDLTGTLPASLGNMNEMSGKIELHDDAGMTGELPAAIWKWTKVERFQLKRSGITSIDLTGIENMVNLTEYNTEKNAISGEAPAAIFALPAMEKVYLHDCNYDAVPAGLTAAAGKLSRLYFNGNGLTELPDLSSMAWKSGAKVRFHNNALTFEDLEPIVKFATDENVAELRYSPQATVGAETYTYPAAGSAVNLDAGVGGSANIYTWIKGIDEVVGEASTLVIDAFDAAKNSGKYFAVVQSELVPGLDIHVAPQKLFASAIAQDSLALVALMDHNNGGYANWRTDPMNAWEGVTMDEAGERVVHVNFKNMDLAGTLVDDIGDLTQMGGKIEIHDDTNLIGELPAAIWKWTNVERFQLKRTGITSINMTGIENMVNLTEYNTEKNAISGEAPAAIFALPAMEKVYLHDCNYDAVPAGLTAAAGKLSRLYFNGNGLTELPDLSAMTWKGGAKVRFHNNALTFEDLEPIVRFAADENVAELRYSPQAVVGAETYTYPAAGSAVNLDAGVGGSANIYTWIRGIDEVVGEASTLTIDAFDAAKNSGKYFAVVQSELVPGLDIHVAPQKLFASVTAQDSLALVSLYNNNGGANWSGYDTWLNGPMSAWEYVTMDEAGERVVHVSFKQMDLTGTLTDDIGDLTMMGGKIEFHDDTNLTGELPAAIWKWTNVERFQLKRTGITSINMTGIENMVNLTEYNTEKNAISGEAPAAIFALPAMEKVYLHDCNYDAVPAGLTAAAGKLSRLYFNGNGLTELPDLSAMTWKEGAKVRFHNNALTFEDLEPIVKFLDDPNVAELRYSPQAIVGAETYHYPEAGSAVTLDAGVGGSANIYTWIKGAEDVVGDASGLTIDAFDAAVNSGRYFAVVQSELVPGLDIHVAPQKLFASVQAQDSLALVDLYTMNGGTAWEGYDAWLNGPINTWEGVTVDSASQRVTHVSFKTIPIGVLNQSLEDITQMGGKIEFHDDPALTGELPAFLWKWTNVERFQLKRTGITSINTTGLENMVNLTEFNTEANPITGTIPGVIFTLPAMEKVYLHDCEYDAVPAEMVTKTGMTRLYLNGNNLTSLPDMASMTWGEGAKVRVHENHLTFEDLEGNVAVTADPLVEEFRYSPQANVGEATTVEAVAGDPVTMEIAVGGSANIYTWVKGEEEVVGSAETYTITAVTAEDAGKYRLVVQNELVPGLDILSEPIQLFVDGVTSTYDLNHFGEINVMGNPMTHTLSIQTDKMIERVMIHSINGQQMRNQAVNNQQINLPVSDLTAGLYLVTLQAEGQFYTLKMVKE